MHESSVGLGFACAALRDIGGNRYLACFSVDIFVVAVCIILKVSLYKTSPEKDRYKYALVAIIPEHVTFIGELS